MGIFGYSKRLVGMESSVINILVSYNPISPVLIVKTQDSFTIIG